MQSFEENFPKDFRKIDIKRILGFTTAGKFCQVVCAPGAGKATLLKLLEKNQNILEYHLGQRAKSLKFLSINLHELSSFEELQIVKFLLFSISNKLEPKDDIMILRKQFREAVATICRKFTLVLLFDHFDEFQNHLPRSFYQLLRDTKNMSKYKFAAIFATRRDLVGLVDEQITKSYWDFFIGNSIYLAIFDRKAVEYLFSQIENVLEKKLTASQKKQIVNLTYGHAKLTKIISEQVLQEGASLDSQLLLKNQQVLATLYEIWLFLTAQEQRALHKIAEGELSQQRETKESLINFDLVNENLTFTIPLFEEFVKTIPDITEPKISFDPNSKEILKGESIISELLAPQEYRLLTFLIKNQKRLVERDELIAAVWPHAQITEAVSDEAIDQMVFRLRKKIESEPTKPKHLLTIKGRGIRFIP